MIDRTTRSTIAVPEEHASKTATKLCIKLVTIVFIFLYLQLLLWSVLVHPAIDIDTRWVVKSFFSSAQQSTSVLRLHHYMPMSIFESIFFSTLALLGYLFGSAGIEGVGCGIYGTSLATFEQSMMGVQHKYYWMCLVPWIITFTQNWLQNVGELLVLFSNTTVYEATNIWLSLAILMSFVSVQALLASEVICMAVHGWHAMKNINNENIQWVQKKRSLDGDGLNTTFGLMR